MGYFKQKNGDYVTGINTINQVENGNITEAEYLQLADLFRHLPTGKVILETDGVFSYVDNPNPPDPDPDIDDSEALSILLGGAV